MILWFLFLGSFLALLLIFLRRLRLTYHDRRFQDYLEAEEAANGSESGVPGERGPARGKKAGSGDVAGVAGGASVAGAEASAEAEEAKPKGSTRKLFLTADMHLGRSEFDEAEVLFLAVIEKDEKHLDAHHKLGMLFMKKADYPRAEIYFSKLTNLKKDPVYFSNLGAALYQQQRLVEAAEAFEKALALDARRAARFESLAQIYHELGDKEKALKNFEVAARRRPKNHELKLILADYYEQAGRIEDALSMLNQVLDANPYDKELEERVKELKESL